MKKVLCLVAAASVLGCASKKYVTKEVGEVNQKVDALAVEVEKTQQRVQKTEARVEEVSRDTQEAKGTSQQALQRADAAEKSAKGKLVYTDTISNDKVTFPFNHADVSAEAKLLIDEAIAPFKAENRGVFFEIEGHTDSVGPDEFNQKLGVERATAVRNYLHDQHGVALNRMAVISYGKTRPAVPNDSPAHLAQNRRVVIKVLEWGSCGGRRKTGKGGPICEGSLSQSRSCWRPPPRRSRRKIRTPTRPWARR